MDLKQVFYLPMTALGTVSVEVAEQKADSKHSNVYCLYIGTYLYEVEADSISQHSEGVSSSVMNISLKLYQTSDFHQAMAATVSEIQKVCNAGKCSLYTVDICNSTKWIVSQK